MIPLPPVSEEKNNNTIPAFERFQKSHSIKIVVVKGMQKILKFFRIPMSSTISISGNLIFKKLHMN
jgi:hypothetical protein